MELRSVTRCRLQLAVHFAWQDGSKRRRGKGFTRDVSSLGLFVLSTSCPPAGVLLQFDVLLPSLEAAAPMMRMEADGRVLRVEPAAAPLGVWGFAATSEQFCLREQEKAAASKPSNGSGSREG